MVCTIRRVWASPRVTTVIAEEVGTVRQTRCFVYMTTAGALIAALCEQAERNGVGGKLPIVLTLKPEGQWGHEIEEAELMEPGQP